MNFSSDSSHDSEEENRVEVLRVTNTTKRHLASSGDSRQLKTARTEQHTASTTGQCGGGNERIDVDDAAASTRSTTTIEDTPISGYSSSSNEDTPARSVSVPAPSAAVHLLSPDEAVEIATLDDVEIGAERIYPVKPTRAGAATLSDMTRLKSIKNIPIKTFKFKQLRAFASKVNIKKCRVMTKAGLAEAIVERKTATERYKVVGAGASRSEAAKAAGVEAGEVEDEGEFLRLNASRLNYYRFVNAMSHEKVKPLLAGIARKLTKAELDAKIKPFNQFSEALASVYNDKNEEDIKHMKWIPKGFDEMDEWEAAAACDPNEFKNDITPKQVRSAYSALRSLFARLYDKFNKSGENDDGPVPFREFCENKLYLAYMYAFLEESGSGLLEVVRRHLPNGVFFQSGGKSKKNSKKSRMKGSANSRRDDSLEEIANAQKQKTQDMSYALMTEAYGEQTRTLVAVDQLKDSKKKELKALMGKPKAKSLIKKVKKKEKILARDVKKKQTADDVDFTEDASDEESVKASQATADSDDTCLQLANDYCRQDERSAHLNQELENVKNKMNANRCTSSY